MTAKQASMRTATFKLTAILLTLSLPVSQAKADGEQYSVYELVSDVADIDTTESYIVYGLANNSTSALGKTPKGNYMGVASLYRFYILNGAQSLLVRENFTGNDVPAEMKLVATDNDNGAYKVKIINGEEERFLYSGGIDRLSLVANVNDERGQWMVHRTSNGRFCLKNVASGGYIQCKGSDHFSAPYYNASSYYLGLLYRNVTDQLAIGPSGFTAYVTARATNFALTPGLTAYKVTTATKRTATLTPVTSVPSGTGVIVQGEEGVYNLHQTGDIPLFTDNLLQHDNSITGNKGNYYALDNRSKGVGFYRIADDVTIPANVPFIEVVGADASTDFIEMAFDDTPATPTAIHDILNNPHDGLPSSHTSHNAPHDTHLRNLQGQPVNNPPKGIYIKGGRKYLEK